MSDDKSERVMLNLRVDSDVKQNFDNRIREEYGQLGPYAGIELEREFRYVLDRGDLADLKTAIDDVASTYELAQSEEKTREVHRRVTTVVGYRIAKNVREDIIKMSKDDYRSPGELAETIMDRYVMEGNSVKRMHAKLQKVLNVSDTNSNDYNSVKERRTQTIVSELKRPGPIIFDMTDFDEAVKNCNGISPSDYVRKEYLLDVLDEMGFVWSPENRGEFVDPDVKRVPDIRDILNKPYILMDESDKRLAIKVAAYRDANRRGSTRFSVRDAVDALHGHARRSTIRPFLREIADSSPGYNYNSKDQVLKINTITINQYTNQNEDVLNIIKEHY